MYLRPLHDIPSGRLSFHLPWCLQVSDDSGTDGSDSPGEGGGSGDAGPTDVQEMPPAVSEGLEGAQAASPTEPAASSASPGVIPLAQFRESGEVDHLKDDPWFNQLDEAVRQQVVEALTEGLQVKATNLHRNVDERIATAETAAAEKARTAALAEITEKETQLAAKEQAVRSVLEEVRELEATVQNAIARGGDPNGELVTQLKEMQAWKRENEPKLTTLQEQLAEETRKREELEGKATEYETKATTLEQQLEAHTKAQYDRDIQTVEGWAEANVPHALTNKKAYQYMMHLVTGPLADESPEVLKRTIEARYPPPKAAPAKPAEATPPAAPPAAPPEVKPAEPPAATRHTGIKGTGRSSVKPRKGPVKHRSTSSIFSEARKRARG